MESLPPRRPAGQLDLLALVVQAFGGFFEDADIIGDILGFLGQHDAEIANLQDQQQSLAGVVGYGCLTSTGASGGAGLGAKFAAPFRQQIGPMVGVTKSANGFTLGSKGLWRVDAMQYFDFTLSGANEVDMDIRTYAPNGSLFEQRFNHNENAGAITLTSLQSFVIPAAGYRVEVWVQAALFRGILGGNSYASLNVTKISDETE